MQKYLFHILIIAFTLGVGLRTVFTLSWPEISLLLLVAGGLFVIWRRRSKTSSAPYLLATSLALCFFAVGLLRTDVVSHQFNVSPLESNVGEKIELTGIVVQEPEIREKATNLYVRVDKDLLLVSTNRYSTVTYGDEVTIKGKIERPESFTTDLGREFNYPGYLLARGVEYKMSFANVEVVSHGKANVFISFLLNQKHVLMSGIENVLPEPQSGLGEGLLLGVKQALGEDLEQAFRTTGIVHIVVLSGYNIMLVVVFVRYLLSFVFSPKLRIVVGLGVVICFALVVGLSATVVRASIMASLLLLSQVIGRRYDLLRALLLAGAAMIFINPYLLLYDIGFQLSFMATLGLILIAPLFEKILAEKSLHIVGKEYVVSTIATQIAVLPLLLYYMGQISIVAVIVNLLVLPMVPPAMLLTFISGMVAIFSNTLALPIAFLAHLSLSYILFMATWFAKLPFAAVSIPYFPLPFLFALYVLIGFGGWWLHKKSGVKNDFADWVIEVEEETKEKTSSCLSELPVKSETPIFFR